MKTVNRILACIITAAGIGTLLSLVSGWTVSNPLDYLKMPSYYSLGGPASTLAGAGVLLGASAAAGLAATFFGWMKSFAEDVARKKETQKAVYDDITETIRSEAGEDNGVTSSAQDLRYSEADSERHSMAETERLHKEETEMLSADDTEMLSEDETELLSDRNVKTAHLMVDTRSESEKENRR